MTDTGLCIHILFLSVTSVSSAANPSATGFRETSLSSWDPGGIRTALQSLATVSDLGVVTNNDSCIPAFIA